MKYISLILVLLLACCKVSEVATLQNGSSMPPHYDVIECTEDGTQVLIDYVIGDNNTLKCCYDVETGKKIECPETFKCGKSSIECLEKRKATLGYDNGSTKGAISNNCGARPNFILFNQEFEVTGWEVNGSELGIGQTIGPYTGWTPQLQGWSDFFNTNDPSICTDASFGFNPAPTWRFSEIETCDPRVVYGTFKLKRKSDNCEFTIYPILESDTIEQAFRYCRADKKIIYCDADGNELETPECTEGYMPCGFEFEPYIDAENECPSEEYGPFCDRSFDLDTEICTVHETGVYLTIDCFGNFFYHTLGNEEIIEYELQGTFGPCDNCEDVEFEGCLPTCGDYTGKTEHYQIKEKFKLIEKQFDETVIGSQTVDISSDFGLAAGSIVATLDNNLWTGGGSNIAATSTTSPTTFSVSGTQPVCIRAMHGGAIPLDGGQDCFTSNDGVTYTFTGNITGDGSFTEGANGCVTSVTENSQGAINWTSDGPATSVTLSTTNTNAKNSIRFFVAICECIEVREWVSCDKKTCLWLDGKNAIDIEGLETCEVAVTVKSNCEEPCFLCVPNEDEFQCITFTGATYTEVLVNGTSIPLNSSSFTVVNDIAAYLNTIGCTAYATNETEKGFKRDGLRLVYECAEEINIEIIGGKTPIVWTSTCTEEGCALPVTQKGVWTVEIAEDCTKESDYDAVCVDGEPVIRKLTTDCNNNVTEEYYNFDDPSLPVILTEEPVQCDPVTTIQKTLCDENGNEFVQNTIIVGLPDGNAESQVVYDSNGNLVLNPPKLGSCMPPTFSKCGCVFDDNGFPIEVTKNEYYDKSKLIQVDWLYTNSDAPFLGNTTNFSKDCTYKVECPDLTPEGDCDSDCPLGNDAVFSEAGAYVTCTTAGDPLGGSVFLNGGGYTPPNTSQAFVFYPALENTSATVEFCADWNTGSGIGIEAIDLSTNTQLPILNYGTSSHALITIGGCTAGTTGFSTANIATGPTESAPGTGDWSGANGNSCIVYDMSGVTDPCSVVFITRAYNNDDYMENITVNGEFLGDVDCDPFLIPYVKPTGQLSGLCVDGVPLVSVVNSDFTISYYLDGELYKGEAQDCGCCSEEKK